MGHGLLSQPYWAKDIGGVGNDHVADVKVDNEGSIYITGEFGGTMTVGSATYTSAGSIDVFMAKLSPAGEVIWFKTGGGTGIDRGLKLALGGTSSLVVAGEFLGTATFQGQPLTSSAGTADMFVAVLDRSNGELQWIRQGGGPTGTDRPYGVSCAADGRVCVAGEFRGNATWSGSTIVSTVDPGTGQPDSDVFIASYSSAGDLQWLKQGAAPYADRAIDVVHDASGDVYVTGQFSDTITFDQTHANTLLNASFLVKLDNAGNEVWFRHVGGGGFNHVRDMVLKNDGRLALVGDLQGTMNYFGPVQTSISSGEPFAYYLLDVDAVGSLVGHSTVGSTSGVSAAGLSMQGSELAVLGEFNCQFSDLSALYGTGVFMAVGTEDLFVSKHQVAGLALVEAQQFGGRSAKGAGAIAHLPVGDVVFTGSYQVNVIFPGVPGMQADITTGAGLEGNGAGSYCNDEDYGYFVANTAAALTDGFVARGYVSGREPYDWWLRTNGGCDRVELDPCIRLMGGTNCPDTVRACGTLMLNVDLKFSSTPGQAGNFLGPAVTYLWSSGSTAPTIGVGSTGDYWVRVTSTNGCYEWTDTIHAIIDPAPLIPLISDDVVLNQAANNTQPITLCDPATNWVWTPNGGNAGSVYWTLPDGNQVTGDSVQVDTTGTYTVVSVSNNGCTRQNTIEVVDNPSIELPQLLADLAITFPEDTDGNDTLTICPGVGVEFTYIPTWTVNGVVGDLPEGLVVHWGFEIPPTAEGDAWEQSTTLTPEGTGWIVRQLVVMVSNEPCGEDSILFFETDSIYVDLFPVVDTEVDITGPSVLCDGDSALIQASCTGCDSLVWVGEEFVQETPESIWVFGAGTYTAQGSVDDPNGCSSSDQASITVTVPIGQVLEITPGDGIICPGQSATLNTSSPGTGHVWYGPEGPITGQGAELVTTIPGDYYLVMNVSGCSVTSNSATLFNYGTPFLDGDPGAILCSLEDEVELQVVATPGSEITWQSPLSGTSLTQTVDQPGIYSCSVAACGIVSQLSIEVTLSTVDVALSTPGPYTVCNGDSVLLQATANVPDVAWSPIDVPGPSVWVSSTGAYYMVAEDEGGCADSTAVVLVTAISFPEPLSVLGDTICAGDTAQLSASGSGNFYWYGGMNGSDPLGVGNMLQFVPEATTTVFVQQREGVCTGDQGSAIVMVRPRPVPPRIAGPSSVCEGESITLLAMVPDTVDILWNTPAGVFTTATVHIASASLDDSGLYVCSTAAEGCNSMPVSQQVNVFAPVVIELPTESFLCTGGAVGLSLPSNFSTVQWSTGSVANGILVTSGQELSVTALDQNGCAAAATTVVIEEECDLLIPNVFTPNGDGTNESWLPLGGFVSAAARIFNRWGDLVFEGDMVKRTWTGKHYQNAGECSEGVYYYVILFTRSDGSSMERSGHVQLNR